MTTQTIVDGVTLSAASWANDVDSTAYSVLTGVAGTNTVTATGPANYAYAAARTPIWFIPAVTNNGATTINVTPSGGAALGAKNVFFNGAACAGGELVAGVPTGLVYDGAQFNIVTSLPLATQAQQEAGTATGAYVSPARQQFHPSAAKFWGDVSDGAGTPTLDTHYNVTSIADTATGRLTVTIATDFSTANWVPFCMCAPASGDVCIPTFISIAAGSIELRNAVAAGTLADPASWAFGGFGDQ